MTSSLNLDLKAAGGNYPTYEQQTFLGASIVNFNINAGFGDSSSTLGIELAEDQYNISDGSGLGQGQDVYHNGKNDAFSPPPVGSPVFFTFGAKRATVANVFKKSFDDLYGTSVSKRTNNNGHDHFAFGGILQSYVQNKSAAGNPMYSVQVVDPREILSNIQLILNNYAGSTYGLPNVLNIYGFLEFNSAQFDNPTYFQNPSKTSKLKKIKYAATDPNWGQYYYEGVDMYYDDKMPKTEDLYEDSIKFSFDASNIPTFPRKFPITGTGMSRRGPQGIPYYRIVQAINGMGGLDGPMPDEYKNAGYGGYINFRGLNYVVDLTGLPKLPQFYFLDYDQINVLDLCLEICDVANHELYVTLLPVINHRACSALYSYNNDKITKNEPQNIIAGIIKINAIDKSTPPSLSAIKEYIDNLQNAGTPIENRDVGYELANNVTDKIIVGAQEVDMYYFTANSDRNVLYNRSAGNQWEITTTLKQQILPYYGKFGKRGVTIPKGFGSYQQILLDATSLQANGVRTFYVATEMELRAALISFERWSEFLLQYNDVYMESVEYGDIRESIAAGSNIADNEPPEEISDNYAVTVPRSVWNQSESVTSMMFNPLYPGDVDKMIKVTNFFDGGLPISTCNPPYGWPLYYKRATQIGLPQAGLASTVAVNSKIMTQLATLKNSGNDKEFKAVLNSIWKDIKDKGLDPQASAMEKAFYDNIKALIDGGTSNVAFIDEMYSQVGPIVANSSRLAKKGMENAKQVYNFLKNIAEECLGKKFLVKIPQRVNPNYDTSITMFSAFTGNPYDTEIRKGPFGFVRRSVNKDPLSQLTSDDIPPESGMNYFFLERGQDALYGALRVELNPITDDYEFNYIPDNQGGYFEFDLVQSQLGKSKVVNMGLSPVDASNFVNENGRMSAYVRFDHSEHLSFENVSKDSFAQQSIEGSYYIADVSYSLENSSNPNDKFDTSTADKESKPSIAFIKCDVDEKLYFAPKIVYGKTVSVYGQEVDYNKVYSKPNKIFDSSTCTYKDSFRYIKRLYKPIELAGSGSVQIDEVNPYELDEEHVYAIITLPQRIVPTVTSRYRDALSETVNGYTYKHFLMLDTVQGLDGFDLPKTGSSTSPTDPGQRKLTSRYTNGMGLGIGAEAAVRKATENLTFALPNKISVASPSPVYPDLVVLPLRSNERCYGPWLSSYVTSDIVGGKMEFIKDENLAPWNYAGYDNMNAAGKLQAEFASSAMLTSERGGFVVPAAPSGISIAKALLDNGPLVTNISVSVSQAGIRTTYKMDLYTASFGKMQKQVKDMISNISRNRQQQRDEYNTMIRKGLGKMQTNLNYAKLYESFQNGLKTTKPDDYTAGKPGANPADTTVFTAQVQKMPSKVVEDGSTMSGATDQTFAKRIVEGATMSSQMLSKTLEVINSNMEDMAKKFFNSASSNVSDTHAPASFEPDHPNMPSVAKNASEVINYMNKVEGFDDDNFTTWG
jgi:hypothetical protein